MTTDDSSAMPPPLPPDGGVAGPPPLPVEPEPQIEPPLPTDAAPVSPRPLAMHHVTESSRTYPCEACGGELHFDIATQLLKCQHCGVTHELRDIEGAVEENDLATAIAFARAGRSTSVAQVAGEKEIVCQNCGGHTTFAGTLVEGSVSGQTLDVFLAGDDDDAKAVVTGLVEAGGLTATDVGPLHRARQLEGLGLLGITLQFRLGTQFGTAWKLVRP